MENEPVIPIQDIYLRQVVDGENKVLGVAAKQLADPGAGCKMGQTSRFRTNTGGRTPVFF
jgi:hypothetical protein